MIDHDCSGTTTGLVLDDGGQLMLGNGRSVTDADLKTLAGEITLAQTPGDTNTWFDISQALP